MASKKPTRVKASKTSKRAKSPKKTAPLMVGAEGLRPTHNPSRFGGGGRSTMPTGGHTVNKFGGGKPRTDGSGGSRTDGGGRDNLGE